jgi:hypothetical protein
MQKPRLSVSERNVVGSFRKLVRIILFVDFLPNCISYVSVCLVPEIFWKNIELHRMNSVYRTVCVASFLSANKFGEILISGTFLLLLFNHLPLDITSGQEAQHILGFFLQ